MKLFVLAVLAAAVMFDVVASDSDPATPECATGETKQVDCNSCMCANGNWACTRQICPHNVEKRETPVEACVDGDTKMEDCNRCMCRNGNWACTRISCPPKNRDKRGYHTSVSQATSGRENRCQPGSSWKLDCNTCTCVKNGRFAYCTERGCLSPGLGGDFPSGISLRGEDDEGAVSIRKRRSPPAAQFGTYQACTPGSSYRKGCNTCVCSRNGRNDICTQRACLPPGFARGKRDVSGETCTPGTTYAKDCNTCSCPSDGQTAHAACTLKACI